MTSLKRLSPEQSAWYEIKKLVSLIPPPDPGASPNRSLASRDARMRKSMSEVGIDGFWTDFWTGDLKCAKRNEVPLVKDRPLPESFGIEPSSLGATSLKFLQAVAQIRTSLSCKLVPSLIKKRVDSDQQLRAFGDYITALRHYEYHSHISSVEWWMSRTPREFEREVASEFEAGGFEVKVVGGASDGGVDIEARLRGELHIVQCKAHKAPVGPSAARDLLGAMNHCGAVKAYLVSRSGFTDACRDFARGKNIRLVDVDGMLDIWRHT